MESIELGFGGRVRIKVRSATSRLSMVSVVVDLLMLTGLDQIESTDALPPPPR